MKKIMASLDVGSDTVKLVVGEIIKKKLNILAVAEAPSEGIKKGLVVDPSLLLKPLKEVFTKCEEIIGLPITGVIVSVPINDATFTVSEGITKVKDENRTIRGNDVIRALQSSAKGKIASGMELVSIIPTSFRLDNDRIVKEPKNLLATTLRVKSVIVSAPKKTIYPVLACLEKLNVDVLDLAFGSLGDYYEFSTKNMDSEVGIIINLGDEVTTISAFNKGILTNTKKIDLGGASIDNDLAYVFKITKNDAKKLKEKLCLAHKRMAQGSNSEIVTNKDGRKIKINQYDATEVVESRIEEILNLTKKEINHLTKKEISYIIFTGGLTEIKDFSLILEEVYGKVATIGKVREIGIRNNKYSSSAGMIKYYASKARLKDKDFSIFSIEEQEELSGLHKESISDSGVLGKLFGYFFDS